VLPAGHRDHQRTNAENSDQLDLGTIKFRAGKVADEGVLLFCNETQPSQLIKRGRRLDPLAEMTDLAKNPIQRQAGLESDGYDDPKAADPEF
jgi:hypothetical protein